MGNPLQSRESTANTRLVFVGDAMFKDLSLVSTYRSYGTQESGKNVFL